MAADEDRLAPRRLGAVPLEPGDLEDRYRAALALQVVLSEILQLKDVADEARRLGPDEDLAGLRQVLEAGRHVDGVAQQAGIGGSRCAGARHDDPGRDPGVHGQGTTNLRCDARAQLVDGGMDLQHRPHGPLGVVLVGDRVAENGHDRVAEQLVDPAAVAFDDRGGRGEDLAHHRLDVLGIELLRHGSEPGQIAEEYGDLAPFRLPRSDFFELGAALIAEPSPRRVLESTIAARLHETHLVRTMGGVYRGVHGGRPGRHARQCVAGRLVKSTGRSA